MTDRSPARHPTAIIESDSIGERARIYAFTHVFPGAVIGDDVNINDHVLVEGGVRIGDRVTIKSGVQLWDGVVVEDDVFIGPNATFVNDLHPRSKQYPEGFLETTLRRGCSIGANATILGGLTIGIGAQVGAGSVVTKDVPPFAVVAGNPARIVGYVSEEVRAGPGNETGVGQRDSRAVGPAELIRLPEAADLRGSLTYAQVGSGLPFAPRRVFVVYAVPTQDVRGEHAHRSLHQLLMCVVGSCHVMVDDGRGARGEVVLDRPNLALHIPPMVWSTQYRHTADAVLVVLASEEYDSAEYIRDYDEFLSLAADVTSPLP
jgi:acetyltransferase-like isoleucine patch superfamily enzyme/dTDP-4-dehydrorhamnose 3,5-epimerase-like enzyme